MDLHELTHPNGSHTVKVNAERRTVFIGRGYRDVTAEPTVKPADTRTVRVAKSKPKK